MLDIEAQVFSKIADALRSEFDGIVISGEYVNAPASFPYVSIVESDNYITSRYIDSAGKERFATVMYEVNVYSDKSGQKKTVCRKIMKFIDDLMFGMNFTRISLNPVPNVEDGAIYRLNARYEAVTDGATNYLKG